MNHRSFALLVGLTCLVGACGSAAAPSAGSSVGPTATGATPSTTPGVTGAPTTTIAGETTIVSTVPPTIAPLTLPETTATPTTPAPTTTMPAPTTATAVVITPVATLGWWDGSAWIDDDVITPDIPVAAGTSFSVFGVDAPLSTATAGSVQPDCEFIGSYTVALSPPFAFNWDVPTSPVAVNATWNPLPHPPAIIDPATPPAQASDAVAAQLTADGLVGETANIVQVLLADLDGDGADELLITAEHPAFSLSEGPRAGWYSMVLLVRTVAGTASTTVVASDVHHVDDDTYPNGVRYRIDAIGDLNGDGRSEIVVGDREFEGVGATVYEVPATGATVAVLSGGCGA